MILDNADLGPLDHALPPRKGPVPVFHTFIRFLLSALWSLKFSPNIYQSQTTRGKKKFSKSTKAWTSLLSQRKQMNEQFYDAPLHPFFFYAFWIDCQGMHFLVSVNIIHSKWSNIYEDEIEVKKWVKVAQSAL